MSASGLPATSNNDILIMHFSHNSLTRIVLLLLLSTGFAYAQDETAAGDEQKQGQETQQDTETKAQPEVETPDTFEATEQLSEDIAAEFPVDI